MDVVKFEKNFDSSFFSDGLTIPVHAIKTFLAHVGQPLSRGESRKVIIKIEDQEFTVNLSYLNVKKTERDIVQFRWGENSPIAIFLREHYSEIYKDLCNGEYSPATATVKMCICCGENTREYFIKSIPVIKTEDVSQNAPEDTTAVNVNPLEVSDCEEDTPKEKIMSLDDKISTIKTELMNGVSKGIDYIVLANTDYAFSTTPIVSRSGIIRYALINRKTNERKVCGFSSAIGKIRDELTVNALKEMFKNKSLYNSSSKPVSQPIDREIVSQNIKKDSCNIRPFFEVSTDEILTEGMKLLYDKGLLQSGHLLDDLQSIHFCKTNFGVVTPILSRLYPYMQTKDFLDTYRIWSDGPREPSYLLLRSNKFFNRNKFLKFLLAQEIPVDTLCKALRCNTIKIDENELKKESAIPQPKLPEKKIVTEKTGTTTSSPLPSADNDENKDENMDSHFYRKVIREYTQRLEALAKGMVPMANKKEELEKELKKIKLKQDGPTFETRFLQAFYKAISQALSNAAVDQPVVVMSLDSLDARLLGKISKVKSELSQKYKIAFWCRTSKTGMPYEIFFNFLAVDEEIKQIIREGIADYKHKQKHPHSNVKELSDAVLAAFPTGFVFNTGAIKLLEKNLGRTCPESEQRELKRLMFKRSDDVYLLPEMVATENDIARITDRVKEYFAQYGCLSLSVLYDEVGDSLRNLVNPDSDFRLFLLKSVIPALSTGGKIFGRLQQQICIPGDENEETVIATLADRVRTALQEYGDAMFIDELSEMFPYLNHAAVEMILQEHCKDAVEIKLDDLSYWKLMEFFCLPDDFAEFLQCILNSMEQAQTAPSLQTLSEALDQQYGDGFREIYAMDDDEVFKQIIVSSANDAEYTWNRNVYVKQSSGRKQNVADEFLQTQPGIFHESEFFAYAAEHRGLTNTGMLILTFLRNKCIRLDQTHWIAIRDFDRLSNFSIDMAKQITDGIDSLRGTRAFLPMGTLPEAFLSSLPVLTVNEQVYYWNHYMLSSIAACKIPDILIVNDEPSPYTVTAMSIPHTAAFDNDVIDYVFKDLKKNFREFSTADDVFEYLRENQIRMVKTKKLFGRIKDFWGIE